MKTSVEMSMYPLEAEYGTPILKFIERLRQNDQLKVETNNMSTQVFGEYDEVMRTINQEMKKSFEENETVVMVMKVVNLGLGS